MHLKWCMQKQDAVADEKMQYFIAYIQIYVYACKRD